MITKEDLENRICDFSKDIVSAHRGGRDTQGKPADPGYLDILLSQYHNSVMTTAMIDLYAESFGGLPSELRSLRGDVGEYMGQIKTSLKAYGRLMGAVKELFDSEKSEGQ